MNVGVRFGSCERQQQINDLGNGNHAASGDISVTQLKKSQNVMNTVRVLGN